MNEAVFQMLNKYKCVTYSDYKNALKEIIQEIALLGLWRAKFFEKAAFYGGTALRILYKLDRFSEDLDFSLLKKDKKFTLDQYKIAIEKELKSFGFDITFITKTKTNVTAIQSAFFKTNTLMNLIKIDMPLKERKKCHIDERIKIKLEIDTNPPLGFTTSNHYLLQPIAFAIKAYSKEDLFAGKIHAILYRSWKKRIKGRDWYDFVWFIANDIPLHFNHLKKRIAQTDNIDLKTFSKNNFKQILKEKISKLDIKLAKNDILPFIKKPEVLQIWSKDFFLNLVDKIKFV